MFEVLERFWPVYGGVLQIQSFADVVSQDEGKDGILHEVIEWAAGVLVEMGKVLKVGYLSWAPQVRERADVAVFQQVRKIWGQDVVIDIITELRSIEQNKETEINKSS